MGKGKAHRQKDKYYVLAKEQGFRARSAFKLIQLNKKYDFLSTSHVLLDLCAAPGGWCQVAAKYMPVSSVIIGVDLVPIRPIRGVITHAEDITTQKCRQTLKRDLAGKQADVVLHDGAPNVGAAWIKDAYGQSELTLHALKLAVEFLRPNGIFVTKVFRSKDYNSLMWVFQKLFRKGFLAPQSIDPKLLDAKYVFKDLESAPAKVDVLHSKAGVQKRNREGYDDSLGPTLHRATPVRTFIIDEDPVRVLSDANQLIFDEESAEFLKHPSTTAEIRALCDDLKLLSKKEFKELLRWRSGIRREHAAAVKAQRDAERGEEKKDTAPVDTEATLDEELEARALEAARREKRVEKKVRREQSKQLQRIALGMHLQNTDVVEDQDLFRLQDIKKAADLEGVREVDVSYRESDALGNDDIHVSSDEDMGDSEDEDMDDEERYLDQIEDNLDTVYTQRQAAAAQRTLDAPERERKGTKLTRKQRVAEEAKLHEAKLNEELEYEHQRYLQLLAGANKRSRESDDDDDSDDDSDEDDSDDNSDADGNESDGSDAQSTRAERWFSQSMFDEIDDDEDADQVAAAHRGLAASDSDDDDGAGSDASDADEKVETTTPLKRKARSQPAAGSAGDDDDDVEDDRLAVGSGLRSRRAFAEKLLTNKKQRAAAQNAREAGELGMEQELGMLPLSEREKRRVLRKREEQRKAKLAARDKEHLQVVQAEVEDAEAEADDQPQLKDSHTRDLIRKGMGAAVDTPDDDTAMQVVPAEAAQDPRLEEYDSDTHAELVALAMKMRRHTRAKELIDASYNRYSFNDPALPKWFVDDESRNFRPTLPITRDEVDAIKAKFRDIASRPIAKVAEARARKKHRLLKNMAKAKQKAESIVDAPDLSAQAKARAIAKAYRGARSDKKPSSVYVVSANGRQVGAKGKKANGGKVKFVDARLRKDMRGQKRAEAKQGRKRQRTK